MKHTSELCLFEIHICPFFFLGTGKRAVDVPPKYLYAFMEPSALSTAYLSSGRSSSDTNHLSGKKMFAKT